MAGQVVAQHHHRWVWAGLVVQALVALVVVVRFLRRAWLPASLVVARRPWWDSVAVLVLVWGRDWVSQLVEVVQSLRGPQNQAGAEPQQGTGRQLEVQPVLLVWRPLAAQQALPAAHFQAAAAQVVRVDRHHHQLRH